MPHSRVDNGCPRVGDEAARPTVDQTVPTVRLTRLPVALPLVLLAGYVRLAAGSPVVYRQTRVGRDGTAFRIVKFRTMYDGAELTTGPVQALRDDPRVGPGIGRGRGQRGCASPEGKPPRWTHGKGPAQCQEVWSHASQPHHRP